MTATIACPACTLLCEAPATQQAAVLACPRCAAPLHHRKPGTLERTWALLLSAAILYVPANTLPVMDVTTFGQSQADTILSGVVQLFQSGMWEIGILIFVASITVPLLKLIGLAYLLLTVDGHAPRRPKEQARLYRLVEYIGRWSMIDMFMLSILVALVQLGQVATIVPGPGSICFAAVVVLTMLAASTFDPRLLWDKRGEE